MRHAEVQFRMNGLINILLAAGLLASLAGCATVDARAAAKEAVAQRIAFCSTQYPRERQALDRAHCEAPARRASMRVHGAPNDLADLLIAKQDLIASQFDAGHLTKEEATLQLNQAIVDATQLRNQRLVDLRLVQP